MTHNSVAPLLQVRGLKTYFFNDRETTKAVDGVSFEIGEGERFGLVGESGSGKTMTALSIIRLLRSPARTVAGVVVFDGKDLLTLPEEDMLHIRGSRIAMIFQNPRACLNPVLPVGKQVARVYRVRQGMTMRAAKRAALEALRRVDFPDPEHRMWQYPHQLSGGMCQRALIATMLACEPALLIADEPTTSLDVTVQARILELILKLQAQTNLGLLLISHDIGLIAQTCQRLGVMRRGRLVEQGPVNEVLVEPQHSYTRGLLDSTPRWRTDEAIALKEPPRRPCV